MKYLGPAHTLRLEEGGKVYLPGDNVPISLQAAMQLNDTRNGGHMFEGLQDALDKATRPDGEEPVVPHDIMQDVAPDQAPPATTTLGDPEAPSKTTKSK